MFAARSLHLVSSWLVTSSLVGKLPGAEMTGYRDNSLRSLAV